MKDIDTFTYNHTLNTGEELTFRIAFSVVGETKQTFMYRSEYMWEAMQEAINKREKYFKKDPK